MPMSTPRLPNIVQRVQLSAEELASALGARRYGKNWRGPCPSPTHDDRNPSLDITQAGDRVLFICRAGCSQTEVIQALRSRGLWARRGESVSRRPRFTWTRHLDPGGTRLPACCLEWPPHCQHWRSFDADWIVGHLRADLTEAAAEIVQLYETALESLTREDLTREL